MRARRCPSSEKMSVRQRDCSGLACAGHSPGCRSPTFPLCLLCMQEAFPEKILADRVEKGVVEYQVLWWCPPDARTDTPETSWSESAERRAGTSERTEEGTDDRVLTPSSACLAMDVQGARGEFGRSTGAASRLFPPTQPQREREDRGRKEGGESQQRPERRRDER